MELSAEHSIGMAYGLVVEKRNTLKTSHAEDHLFKPYIYCNISFGSHSVNCSPSDNQIYINNLVEGKRYEIREHRRKSPIPLDD